MWSKYNRRRVTSHGRERCGHKDGPYNMRRVTSGWTKGNDVVGIQHEKSNNRMDEGERCGLNTTWVTSRAAESEHWASGRPERYSNGPEREQLFDKQQSWLRSDSGDAAKLAIRHLTHATNVLGHRHSRIKPNTDIRMATHTKGNDSGLSINTTWEE